MKIVVLAIALVLNTASPLKDGAVFLFTGKTVHTFKDTLEGELLSHVFEFVNNGTQPLIISHFEVACSCTKAIFSKEPILPGQKSVIEITFDTNGKYGYQDRTVKIYSNAKKNPVKVRIKTYVYSKKDRVKE